jgi:DNA mismatch endonuclease (patch repair protein)
VTRKDRTPLTRAQVMSRIRGKDTKPEMLVRRGLHARGFRYRLHARGLPGRPDMVLARHGAVIFVNGCFWHGHEGCPHFRMPKTRVEYWQAKIGGNQARDRKNIAALLAAGWRVMLVWECSVRREQAWPPGQVIDQVANWLRSDASQAEIAGRWTRPLCQDLQPA